MAGAEDAATVLEQWIHDGKSTRALSIARTARLTLCMQSQTCPQR